MSVLTGTPPAVIAPALIRGRLVTDHLVDFDFRKGEGGFRAPDPRWLVEQLPLRGADALGDLHELAFEEIVGYLDRLGQQLDLATNPYLQQALECSSAWSEMTAPLVRASFELLPSLFAADAVREMADRTIGIPYLDGWVEQRMRDGRLAAIRAIGARAIHVIAGNSPAVSALTIIRNAIARSDAIIKIPSNDPLSAVAIARTMSETEPDHPITRHLSAAYWRGGDTVIERSLYAPANIEKIIAWGGLASITHIAQYIQPGIELVTLDPKRSATLIGHEAFESERTLREVALRAAADVGALNQLGCVNARVIYVHSGTDPEGLERANALGAQIYHELQKLPSAVSTKARRFDPELRAAIQGLRAAPEWYRLFGGNDDEGAIIVSQLDTPVEFHHRLSGRVANVVPIDNHHTMIRAVTSYTQTIGVYPESLKATLRDVLALNGAQRLVSLGYAAHPSVAGPQDAIEPLRRMTRWIIDESCDPNYVQPLWSAYESPTSGAISSTRAT